MKCLILCCILGVSGWAGQATRVEIAYNPAQIGQPVLLRAAVYVAASRMPVSLGYIAFTSDGVEIAGCGARWVYMSSGAAECETTFPKLATYHVVATYGGVDSYAPSSASVDIVVGKLFPSAWVAFYPPNPVWGGPLVLNARLFAAPGMPRPTGTVTFSDGGKELVTRPLVDGVAGLDMPLDVRTHHIEAVYNGDDIYQTATAQPSTAQPSPLTVTVAKGPPGMWIASSPAQIRQPVTLGVLVLPEGAGGTVTFTGVSGCVNIPVRAGRAECSTTFYSLGTVMVGADYSGDANLTPRSVSMQLTVGRVVAGVFVAITPAAPVYGQPLQVGALVLGAPGVAQPTGIVTFSDSMGSSGSGVLNAEGHALWTVQPPAGSRLITATYNGDSNYGTSQGVGTLVIGKAPTATSIVSTDGRIVTATVAVTGAGRGTPTGTVRFLRDGIVVGSEALSASPAGAIAKFDATGNTGNIRAEYTGDLNFLASVSPAVLVTSPSIDLRLMSDRNPAPAGNVAFILTAAATPGPGVPSGTVQLTVDGAVAGTATLFQGTATVTVDLKPGTHAVAATYSGDALYPPASASLTQVVTSPAGTVILTANPQSPVYGEPITVTAQLPAGATGKVEFTDSAVPLGVTDGVLTVSRLDAGMHAIAASWSGDAAWSAATARLALTVAKAHTATSLTVSGGLAAARVLAIAPGAGTPSGSIHFADGVTGQSFAVAPLDGGTASAPLPAGVSLVTALYEGDSNFAASRSASAGLLTAVNAASYSAALFAPGEIVTIFGANVAGAASAMLTDAAGVVQGVDLASVAEGQSSAVLPEQIADGTATLTIAGMTAALPIARSAPGLFTLDASGHGSPAGQVIHVRADGSQDSTGAEAIDLDGGPVYLILYGTGLRHYKDRVVCTIGGRAIPVLFVGPQGGAAGVDQLNLLLPAELKGSGMAEVVVTADGVPSNAVTVVFR